jgi:hypothetical protein
MKTYKIKLIRLRQPHKKCLSVKFSPADIKNIYSFKNTFCCLITLQLVNLLKGTLIYVRVPFFILWWSAVKQFLTLLCRYNALFLLYYQKLVNASPGKTHQPDGKAQPAVCAGCFWRSMSSCLGSLSRIRFLSLKKRKNGFRIRLPEKRVKQGKILAYFGGLVFLGCDRSNYGTFSFSISTINAELFQGWRLSRVFK